MEVRGDAKDSLRAAMRLFFGEIVQSVVLFY